MNNFNDSQLYKEELEFIFGERGSGVRKATVISAFIESQVFLLASIFLKKHQVEHKPDSYQEYSQSMNILQVNRIIDSEELEIIKKFRKERNKSIHGIFKGMTRKGWDMQNKLVIDLGRSVITILNQKIANMSDI